MSPLFVPGPVDVAPEVLEAQTGAMVPHRSAAYEEIFHRAEANARKIFMTDSRVFISASSGTGFHEAAVRNFVSGKMLSCVNGAFSSRWYKVALANGKDTDLLETNWQEPITAELVAEQIQKEKYDIITIVHNETSTGLMNPVAEIAAVVHDLSPDTLVCVDAVSSLSGAKVEMDGWGLDMVLTSSQKCLALPPGLSLAAVNDRALDKARTVENRGWYFDLVMLEDYRVKNSTPATSAISLVYALDFQLQRILEEGLENRFARHSGMASHTQAWAKANELDMFAPEGYRSQTVTTIENTRKIDVAALNAWLGERGMKIAGGYGVIKERTFRIGHMGELTNADLDMLFAAMEEFLG